MSSTEGAVTDQQREVARYLWLSQDHPETWPMKVIDQLVALRQHDERKFLLEIAAMMKQPADDRKGVALAFMKRASRDTFRVCAKSAEELAQQIESGALPMDAPTACRFLAAMFQSAANRAREE